MARTYVRQDTQIRRSDLYDDTIAPTEAAFETNTVNIEDDLNTVRSMLSHLLDVQAGNWWDVINTPSALETGSQRGVNDLNTGLHAIEKKRVLRDVHNLTDVTVGAGDNFVLLGVGELPAQLTAAVGTGTTLGTVVAAHGGTFGTTHSLVLVTGNSALNPQNLMAIVDGATRDPILSAGRKVYGLLHGESTLLDGETITVGGTDQVQVSFVRQNVTGNALEATPVADIENLVINYSTRERVRLEDLNEQDFLTGAIVDVGIGAGTIDLQTAYTNQGATVVSSLTNIDIKLDAPGIQHCWLDDLAADLFCIKEGSAGGTSEVQIGAATDVFNVDAILNNFDNGASFDTGAAGTTINIGITPNQVDSGGVLSVASGGGADLNLVAALEMNLTDSYRAGSTWSLADGISLSNSAAEWSAFELEFGEVSLLAALTAAGNTGGIVKASANVTSTETADTDISLSDGNLDVALGDLSGGSFVDDHDIYLNGRLQRNGANAAANNDVYPGTDLDNTADGQLKFEKSVKVGDVICVISRA